MQRDGDFVPGPGRIEPHRKAVAVGAQHLVGDSRTKRFAGQARAAALYDFKTDERALAENYSTQMSLYRKSLGSLIGLPEPKITSTLILVRTGEELPVRSPGDLVQMHLV